jgi:glycosyltransferase involved in cell wall biosynthesis
MSTPTLGVLIRFSDSASTLPAVLAALKSQTLQPDVILGVNCGSTDASSAYIRATGGRIAQWTQPYAHASVLNFGLRLLPTDLVLILSSHTVLESPDTLAQMVAAMRDPAAACVSLAWDDDPFYSDAITFAELQRKGLRFGSFYSNSMGMIRRRHWQKSPFDESIPTAEDYAWAIEQLKKGHTSLRLRLPFSYRRDGTSRAGPFARVVFQLARRHSLKVTWLGPFASLKLLATHHLTRLLCRPPPTPEPPTLPAVTDRLTAWLISRFAQPT